MIFVLSKKMNDAAEIDIKKIANKIKYKKQLIFSTSSILFIFSPFRILLLVEFHLYKYLVLELSVPILDNTFRILVTRF